MTPEYSCERCRDALPWYIAHALSPDERAAMERHLDSCARCRAALDEWRAVAAALHRADERIPLDTASLTTWEHISGQLREQIGLLSPANERTTMGRPDTRVPPTGTQAGEAPAARRHRHVPALVSLVAAAAVIALSIGVFSHFSTHSNATVTTHPSCTPSQATVNLPAHAVLRAIAPVGTNDGWLVGEVMDPTQPTLPPSTLILRLQNCQWAPFGTPISKATLADISMATPDEGWAVGSVAALDTSTNTWEPSRPLVLHFTQGSWHQVQVPADPTAYPLKVKMVSADEGWMLLGYPSRVESSQSAVLEYSLLHYQKGLWTNTPLDFHNPQMVVSDFDARQSGEVWLVGFDTSGGNAQPFAARYSHGVLTPYSGAAFSDDPKASARHTDFFSIGVSALSSDDVWVTGPGGLRHFDGTHWVKASIQGTTGVTGDTPSYAHLIGHITMASSTQGWAFPAFGDTLLFNTAVTRDVALRYDHGAWRWTRLEIRGAKAPMPISDFVQSSPTQGWALAQQIFNVPEHSIVLLYYDSGNWGIVRQQQ